MKPNKKLIAGLVFLLLAVVSLNVFLILKYKTKLSKPNETKLVNETDEMKKPLIPFINTYGLPPGQTSVNYRTEVFATIPGGHEDLTITVNGLPEGLSLGECVQRFDSQLLPQPNTQTKCSIKGIPIKIGVYQVKIIDSTEGNYNTTVNTINLVVTP